MTKQTKVEKDEVVEESTVDSTAQAETVEQESKDENAAGSGEEQEDFEAKFKAENDRYLRLYSEFDNFRKRTQKEKIELYKTAGEDVITAILPVLDDLDRALMSIEENEANKALRDGVVLIQQKLVNSLNQQGLKPIESSVGKDFDVNIHEAISRVPAPSKKMKGKIIDEVEKGYTLNDKVIRYTKVVIGE